MEETNDWFYRRKGAFQDALTATERLLDVGMKPRWQLFLTKRILPEIDQLLEVVEGLRLRERVASLGGEFDIFMHTPAPDGEARHIQYLRPTLDEIRSLPEEIVESSKKHFQVERLWYTEGELISEILEEEPDFPYGYSYPSTLWMTVRSDWNVFSNMAGQEEWWRLGNLKKDTVGVILNRFQNNRTLGLETIYRHSPKDLAEQFGNPKSQRIYECKSDLLSYYVERYCEEEWRRRWP
jgi:MoaA/NifB/PqqE/SkfB family radical SAM enzyme